MLPITDGALTVSATRKLHIKDPYLKGVLAGDNYLVFDGAMGTMLQRSGLKAGELPELLCLTNPDEITAIHKQYVSAGSMVVTTNTFGANAMKLGAAASVAEVFAAAVACARKSRARYVAADIGPLGALLEPMGTLPFDTAYDLFAEQVKAADAAGADLFIIETMTDLLEMKAAVLAAKENSQLPIFATMTFEENGRSFLGTTPEVAARTLAALGVDAFGVNCSLGPIALRPLVKEILESADLPVIVQANAGLPEIVDGETVYSILPEEYANAVLKMVEDGATVIGGCCGTDPAYIKVLAHALSTKKTTRRSVERVAAITSAQESVVLRGKDVAVIGERINPTGKKKLKAALRDKDYGYVIEEVIAQMDAGADVLDVNAGLPEIDEAETLRELVKEIQAVSSLPLQIDSSDPTAVEAAVRAYAGKPLINSVNGKQESLQVVLPLAKHYGCAVVGLTLDESGIPETAEGRFAIAERIVREAEKLGIPREDIYIDCLVMAASTNQDAVAEILRAVSMVKSRLGVRIVLGVSNISFGLPGRPVINATFLSAAFAAGLDLPIINPLSSRYREVVDSWRVLNGQDKGATSFIGAYGNRDFSDATQAATSGAGAAEASAPSSAASDGDLRSLVLSGNKGPVPAMVRALLKNSDPMEVINGMLIPALDEVGILFENGTFFLPQLMASAEAAKAGFDTIREASSSSDAGNGPIVLATVKGDIHDIGKNIVKMLLENYGYRVIDLGRDVDPQLVVDTVITHEVKLVGLSALMTTTVRGMEETIQQLRAQVPFDVKVMVGGAVLNEEYAQMVGADFYAKDAAEAAKIAGELLA